LKSRRELLYDLAMTALSARLRRTWLSLILAPAAIALALNCLFAPRGVRDLIVLRTRQMALEAQLRRLRAENSDLGTRVERLRSDDQYLERAVRSELGLARPDELIYRFADTAGAEH
jgi:cell division protein FtsB